MFVLQFTNHCILGRNDRLVLPDLDDDFTLISHDFNELFFILYLKNEIKKSRQLSSEHLMFWMLTLNSGAI